MRRLFSFLAIAVVGVTFSACSSYNDPCNPCKPKCNPCKPKCAPVCPKPCNACPKPNCGGCQK